MRARVVVAGIGTLTLAACDTFTSVIGRVVDDGGRPVRGAVVVADKGTYQRYILRTDRAGRFEAGFTGGLRSPDALVRACAPGRASHVVHVPDGAQVDSLNLTLVVVGADTGAAPTDAGELPCP